MPNEPELKVIPPLSVVKVTSENPDWIDQKGVIFRIGYYSRNDGLDCVWLVDDSGDYGQTADQDMIRNHFTVLKLSEERDMFGDDREIIGPRNPSS
jgi:hypothetical protein